MKCIFTSHTERSKAHLHVPAPALQRVKCQGTKSTKTNYPDDHYQHCYFLLMLNA